MKAKQCFCIISMLLVFAFVVAACGNNSVAPNSNTSESSITQPSQSAISQEETAESSATEPEAVNGIPTDEDNVTSKTGNILTAYFAVAENSEADAVSSASVLVVNGETKGNIRVLADVIQSNVGGDMFSILTSTKYPADIMEVIDYADKEQKENARPELTSHIKKLDDYDVVFVGYPNWWYDMPMVMYSFFEEYDFSGKTIVPFCTYNGSGFSRTINTIRELEPNAAVLDGFTTNFANVEKVSGDVAEWITELGI